MKPISIATIAGILLTATAAFPADAQVVQRRYEQNGAGACQGALPAFAGTLRARPLSIQNEGSTTAFTTCALTIATRLSSGQPFNVSQVRLFLTNSGTTAQTVSCTLVDGSILTTIDYVTKSTSVGAGFGQLTFELTDYVPAATRIDNPNLSCALPPGIGIGTVWYYTVE